MNQRLPAMFRSLQALRRINTVSVSAALSAATTVALGSMGKPSDDLGLAYFVCGITTFLACLAWMHLLRMRTMLGKTKIRLGWVLSIPIAITNASVSAGILLGAERSLGNFFTGLFFGATLGAIVWIPALLSTLLLFGLPIAWAQRQADQGLAGEERGERIVGLSAFVIASIALALSVWLHRPDGFNWVGTKWEDTVFPHWYNPLKPIGYVALLLTGAAGSLGGLFSLLFSSLREARRKRFVEGAEAGQVKGYRVEATPQGKVLLRVSTDNPDYRVGDIDEEELFALDAQGQAQRAIEPQPQ